MPHFDPLRHEPILDTPWNPQAARGAIERIVRDVRERASDDGRWPNDPSDVPQEAPPMTMLYIGAAGVIWGLDLLAREGMIDQENRRPEQLLEIQQANHAMLQAMAANSNSYLMGDAGVLLARWNAGEDVLDEMAQVISANTNAPARELMWGAPGTMLLALEVHRRTGDTRFADLFVAGAEVLHTSLEFDGTSGAHIWTQDLYGQKRRFLGAVHGFAGNAYVLVRGRDLLSPEGWLRWSDKLTETFLRTAVRDEAGVNWPAEIGADQQSFLLQHCHGAPGMVTCLAQLDGAIDEVLQEAGELIWTAGPLRKGASLCHGTAGNGYAFLKLFERTGDDKWLDRARAFAMHAIAQSDAAAAATGRRRFSLWTGDIGVAIYLWSCIAGNARFPTLDLL